MNSSQQIDGSDGQPIALDSHSAQIDGVSGKGVVLLLHGFKGFKDWGFFPYVAEQLAEAGYDVVRFNTSHNGVGVGLDSEDFTRLDLFRKNRSSYEVADVLRVIAGIEKGEIIGIEKSAPDRIFLMGHSRGGGAMIAAGAQCAVRGVVTWASVASFALPESWQEAFHRDGFVEILNGRTGQAMPLDRTAWDEVNPMPAELDLERCTHELECPLLIVHGQDDPSVPHEAAIALHRASRERAELALIEGADHVMNTRHPFEGATPELECALEFTISFLNAN